MGRPLKIHKYNAMAGIFYNNDSQGTTAAAVAVDEGFNPFAAPTALDVSTVVLPQPATSPLPWTGVVGGKRGTSVSATYPVVQCQVNIALPDGSGQGVEDGVILRQKGARKFLVMSSGQNVEDEEMVVGAAYMIGSLDTTNWQQMGAPVGAAVGTIFICTALCADPQNGYGWLVGPCVLVNDGTPTVGNMAISMSIADSTPTYISKLTNKFVQDFNGGETGGNANTGDVWADTDVVDNIEYAANFFVDGETFAKSGAEVATWGTNGSDQNTGGTLTMAEVEKYTS